MKHLTIFALLLLFYFKNSSCDEVAFIKLTTFRGVDKLKAPYEKEFYVPRYYRATSQEALLLCRHFGMSLAALETVEEYNHLRSAMFQRPNLFTNYAHIGGLTVSPRSSSNFDWYWVESGQRVSYPIDWCPGKPSFTRNLQFCLGLGPQGHFKFLDIDCFGALHAGETFICEKTKFLPQ